MASHILPYPPAAKRALRINARRASVILAICVSPMVVPLVVWIGATWHQIVADPRKIAVPYYFALTAAAGPFEDSAGTGWSGNGLMIAAGVVPWTDFHHTVSPPIPPIWGAALLVGWLAFVCITPLWRWPIPEHMLLSFVWWFFGCSRVLGP
jgi:hypothetical protein